MSENRPLVIGIVAGEQSGENLAVDLVDSIGARLGSKPKLVGVGGGRLAERGLESVFDSCEIAITGVTGVLAALPRLYVRIRQTAAALIAAKPDVIVFIDSPDFSLRVAKRVKRALPKTPILKYVAPTVWAWRPGRARKMAAFVDRILAILPFEPEVMRDLGGPETSYVGHPLAADAELEAVWKARRRGRSGADREGVNLLVLPGSRTGEVRALLPDFGEAVALLHQRGHRFSVSIPTLPRLAALVERETAGWPVAPRITVTRQDKLAAFRTADAALAASGTVILELALAGVPVVSCYRTDFFIRLFVSKIRAWSAALPNIIADRPIVPEYIDYLIRPGMLARRIEELVEPNSQAAKAQIAGFSSVRGLMAVEAKPGTRAAEIVLELVNRPLE
ncbi:MAG: lipid-A-disaccharide synthase [Oricola sp.]